MSASLNLEANILIKKMFFFWMLLEGGGWLCQITKDHSALKIIIYRVNKVHNFQNLVEKTNLASWIASGIDCKTWYIW